ncbi:diadenylate cyclase CdaA [Hornefia butyriciproducens]|jgi:diadenylate cyclase|uniref:Diadenylate cyclase n=1 Tax=Hornefia butyriciproducens TaxID=2652293 RepID=A0A6L5Y2E0_9FIRM|nr:diadenylate cyclase CdaA [Hornefia butyriciproducens]MCI7327178.1 diadenylate cyclase CdaA [Clostridiales bacterium]MCI7413802.1 diadenylate cyclase CdaA [Clostridiales bacterium]MCI7679360.1 diadenylate cyclase CdaA [Clostridiales bacterium]MDD6299971.1 diadenylate cyclase CdaA [Hornefia butyriciproducens]MDY2991144.1 diadenylate cyclase CdaA [Hornefia butyriciproducens]
MHELQTFFTNTIYSIGWNDALDIAITTFVLYKILEFIKETRAQQLVKGLAVLVIAYFLSGILNLHVVHWFLGGAFTVGLFALVVLFQPELRRGLEYMGRSKLFHARLVTQVDKDKAKFICDEIADAAMSFSASKTGALIVFEREITLEDIAETGTLINAEISEELLGNLFYEGSPLHDGAVIIRGDKVYAAGCVLPLTDNKNLNKSLGTRHRAGIGITENSDALTLIVSEETGIISIAQEGKITRFLDKKSVEKILFNLFITEEEDKKISRLGRLGNRLGRGKHASK